MRSMMAGSVGRGQYGAGVEILVAVQGPTAYLRQVQPAGGAGPAARAVSGGSATEGAVARSDGAVAGSDGAAGRSGGPAERIDRADLPARIAQIEADRTAQPPRWVWADTRTIASVLLPAGVRVRRCLDLRLCHAILRGTPAGRAWPDSPWDDPAPATGGPPSLLDELLDDGGDNGTGVLADLGDELLRQRRAIEAQDQPARMRLLLAAESVGALIAAEMHADGLPWDRAMHDDLLTAALGPRPQAGTRPQRLELLAAQIRTHLQSPTLNPDSPAELLRALRAQGMEVRTTRKWELARIDHPVTAPLLEYKRLARLLSANGWVWLDEWVERGAAGRRGRFRPEYVVGGVVTGRWASSGGGALQLPGQVRGAVRADPGYRLVVADAAQIEPRVLAAMAGDAALARAGQGGDLYQGLVDTGVVPTREAAKVGMLGALYGGTSGDSGALMPRLRRAYPRAIEVVEQAARTGEQGGTVHTWLGRTSPPPGQGWQDAQRRGGQVDAGADAERLARSRAREWGRFTRNFVVQGTAAEWALCWLGEIRRRLRDLESSHASAEARPGPHLVFFLHDEVIVHAPADLADQAAEVVREAARAAGRLMFGGTAVDFPLSVSVVDDYAQAH